ncbi:hypothetical protein Rt10032_c12g4860 [Rhodotorula toruloides]|uniref:Uncharacterized protein n=1 Tax=Rhodotorula toruloides TaxID=5286 RepID=A0A511KKE4_RHOTO|nr:hypothetical protein Rt10032_c12g4860 [Rhodotorula toruloides]
MAAGDFAGGGGFLPEDDAGGGRGGGVLPEDDGAGSGGGFLPEPPSGITIQPSDADADAGGGGFLLDDFTYEGGFLPLPPPPLADLGDPMAVDYAASTSSNVGGGFLPEPPAEFSSAGGFLPSTSGPSSSLTFPSPPPPSRIPLGSIPTALRTLNLRRLGLPASDLMQLFEEVASEDETAEGGKSVRRERFREACEVLMGDMDDDEEEEEEEYRDEGEEEEEEEEKGAQGRKRLRRAGKPKPSTVPAEDENDAPKLRRQPARRSTRANPLLGNDDISAKDFGAALDALPDDSGSSLSEVATDSEDDDVGGSVKKKGKSPAKSKGKKSRRRGRAHPDDMTAEDVVAAQDTFDLFFEESPQSVLPKRERAIGLMELQRACRVLKEKMTDGDLNEMLEYAARSKGLVDLESFARILVETGL